MAEAKGGFQDFLAQSQLHAELSPEEIEAFMERTLEEMQALVLDSVGELGLGLKVWGLSWLVAVFFGLGEVAERNLYPKKTKAKQSRKYQLSIVWRRKGTPTSRFEILPPKKGMFRPGVFFFKSCFCGSDFRARR